MQTSTSSHSSPMPRMIPGLGQRLGVHPSRVGQQPERAVVAPARPGQAVEPLGGLEIVVEDVRPGVHHDPERRFRALEVGDEHLDRGLRQPSPDLGDAAGERLGAAVGQVVAVHRGDDHVLQSHPVHRLGQSYRLERVEGRRSAVGDRAVGAVPGADVAQDHESGGLVLPAFADVGTAGLLADGMEVELAHHGLEVRVVRASRGLDLEPGRLAGEHGAGRARTGAERVNWTSGTATASPRSGES